MKTEFSWCLTYVPRQNQLCRTLYEIQNCFLDCSKKLLNIEMKYKICEFEILSLGGKNQAHELNVLSWLGPRRLESYCMSSWCPWLPQPCKDLLHVILLPCWRSGKKPKDLVVAFLVKCGLLLAWKSCLLDATSLAPFLTTTTSQWKWFGLIWLTLLFLAPCLHLCAIAQEQLTSTAVISCAAATVPAS